MRVLLDTNVLLDVLLDRQPWVSEAVAVTRACAAGKCVGYVTAITVPTLFYVVRKLAGLTKAREAVRLCLESFDVLPVARPALEAARALPGNDYEDNVQVACAVLEGLDAIVTRDQGVAAAGQVAILTPAELLARLAQPPHVP